VRELVFIAALLASTPAFAWMWETDDGRNVTNVQVNQEGAACAVVAGGGNGYDLAQLHARERVHCLCMQPLFLAARPVHLGHRDFPDEKASTWR
jgi:hypothetical protein